MNVNIILNKRMMFCFVVIFFWTGCETKQVSKNIIKKSSDQKTIISTRKPGSSFQDTLFFNKPIAVFFSPDSFQLTKIKETTEKWMFDGLMHEYEFQFFYSKKILKRDWPHLEIVENNKARYLSFPGEFGNREMIDLDKMGEPYGLIIYNGVKKAAPIDMPNIEYLLPQFIVQ